MPSAWDYMEDPVDLAGLQPAGVGWWHSYALDPGHRVGGDVLVTVGPGEKARQCRLRARTAGRAQLAACGEERAQLLDAEQSRRSGVVGGKPRELGAVGPERVRRAAGMFELR